MREGQREYRVHPAFDGGARTDVLVRDGRFAALYRIAAHNADDGVVFRFQHLKLLFVSEVKGVVFADDGGDAQTARRQAENALRHNPSSTLRLKIDDLLMRIKQLEKEEGLPERRR